MYENASNAEILLKLHFNYLSNFSKVIPKARRMKSKKIPSVSNLVPGRGSDALHEKRKAALRAHATTGNPSRSSSPQNAAKRESPEKQQGIGPSLAKTIPLLSTQAMVISDSQPLNEISTPKRKVKTEAARRWKALRNVILVAHTLRTKDLTEYQILPEKVFEDMAHISARLLFNSASPKKHEIKKQSNETSKASPKMTKQKRNQPTEVHRKEDGEEGEDGKEGIPTLHDLNNLPNELRETFIKIACDNLARQFYPKLLLRRQKRYRAEEIATAMRTSRRLTVDDLRKSTLFKQWPEDLLCECVANLDMMTFDAKEFILHENENSGSGIFFILKGTVQVTKRISLKKKSIGSDNCTVLATLTPGAVPICIGEYALLTEEPRMATVRAVTHTVAWVINKKTFYECFVRVPPACLANISQQAFQKRNANMKLSFPVTPASLLQHGLFRPCSEVMLQELVNGLIPHALPKYFTVCGAEELAQCVYLLANGKCGIYRTINGELTHIMNLFPGMLIGGDSILNAAPFGYTVRTLTNCDLWRLPRDAFFHAFRYDPEIGDRMMTEARLDKQSILFQQRTRYRDFIGNIPLLRNLVHKSRLKDLILLFHPRVYTPLEIICSRAHFCDRIIILTNGRVSIGEARDCFPIGEAIGYTCLIPHRWGHKVQAETNVECLELGLDMFIAILKDFEKYDEILTMTKHLLFPKAFPPEVSAQTQALLRIFKTPRIYIPSESDEVRLYEPGFNYEHVRLDRFTRVLRGEHVAKVPRKELFASTLPPVRLTDVGCPVGFPTRLREWRQSSNGMFIKERPVVRLPKL